MVNYRKGIASSWRRISARAANIIWLASLALASSPSFAQALEPSGTIDRVWLASGQNYAFRVYISNANGNPLASCTMGFAYLNVSHTNYQAIVATILSSYGQRKAVKLHAYKEDSGFCRIDEVEA